MHFFHLCHCIVCYCCFTILAIYYQNVRMDYFLYLLTESRIFLCKVCLSSFVCYVLKYLSYTNCHTCTHILLLLLNQTISILCVCNYCNIHNKNVIKISSLSSQLILFLHILSISFRYMLLLCCCVFLFTSYLLWTIINTLN